MIRMSTVLRAAIGLIMLISLALSVVEDRQGFPLWASTGFSPPEPHSDINSYVVRKDVRQLISIIGSLPYRPHTFQVRVHWLLNLVKVIRISKNFVDYDMSDLDTFVNYVHSQNVRLGFEIMGNPSNVFDDFENSTQLVWWYQLVKGIGQRYADKAVSHRWNFESWNEPDHADFDGLNFTTKGFMNYLNVTGKGLHDADSRLLFGGPAASCRLTNFSHLCWSSLWNIAYNGLQQGRIDFISFHKKGSKRSVPPGNAQYLSDSELEMIRFMRNYIPKLSNITIYNDEADPVKGWRFPMEFRADLRYPAMVAKIISMHAYSHDPELRAIRMLSNDNAFLGFSPHYFTQRTLFARFILNTTRPPESVLVKKPIYDLMTLLTFMQGDWVELSYNTTNQSLGGLLAVETKDHLSVVVYGSNDTGNYRGRPIQITFQLPDKYSQCNFTKISLNQQTVYDQWQKMGRPENLTSENINTLWSFPSILVSRHSTTDFHRDSLSSKYTLEKKQHSITSNSAKVIELTIKPPTIIAFNFFIKCPELSSPYNLTFSCIGTSKVLLVWQDLQTFTCFETYEVYFKSFGTTDYSMLNSEVVLARFYQRVGADDSIAGMYMVRSRNRISYSSFSNVAYLYYNCSSEKP